MNILEELKWRDMLKQVTNETKVLKAAEQNKAVYCGFDPTAESLHVGHLIQILNLKRFELAGFKPIALIGGGTGMIGDPSFKSQERQLLTDEQVLINVSGIKKQLERLIPNIDTTNNADWLGKMSLIDFLRDVGKDFNLSYLLHKENIKTRIETGLSITEFAYTMLQAYDFYNLYTNNDCWVQIGGSDQWGNITSGTDYISSIIGNDNSNACGVTMNLLTKKDGVKFGKTESGAVWLDPNKTSVYEFYQFFLNQEDEDCEKLLKSLTFLSKEEINKLITAHGQEPFKRLMQKELAKQVTTFVHGENGYNQALEITDAFFNGKVSTLPLDIIKSTLHSIPTKEVKDELNIIDFLVEAEVASSKREAREFVGAGAVSINDQLIKDEEFIVNKKIALDNSIILIKRGKRKYFAAIIK